MNDADIKLSSPGRGDKTMNDADIKISGPAPRDTAQGPIKLRCSFLHRVFACVPSLYGPEMRTEGDRLPAAFGWAEHELLREHCETGAFPDVPRMAGKWGVDAEELASRHRQTAAAFALIRDWLPEPQWEVGLEYADSAIHLTGHIDLLSTATGQVRILDLKSGWRDEDHRDQLRGYAWLTMQATGVEEVFAAAFKPRSGKMESYLWTAEELRAWWQHLCVTVREERNTYRPGYKQCLHCPRAVTCEARTKLIQQAVLGLLCNKPPSVTSLGLTLDQVKLVEKICADTKEWIKVQVARAGGQVDAGDGRDLVLTKQQRETVRYSKDTIAIVDAILDRNQWPQICHISKTDLKQAIMERVPRGQKTQKAEAILDELRSAGQIETTYFEKLELRRRAEDERAIPDHVTGTEGPGGPS